MAANPNATWTELVLLSQAVIQNIGLVYGSTGTPLPNAQVYPFKFPTDAYRNIIAGTGSALQLPCVQVYAATAEDPANHIQDFENTEVIFPVLVAILFSDNKTLSINNDLLYWRQQIYAAFEDFPDSLGGEIPEFVSDVEVWDLQISTRPVLDMAIWQKENLDFSWLILNWTTTRSRGRSSK